MRICFVADGGLQLGMGHVQQSTTLASALRGRADIWFVTKSDDTVAATIRQSGFEVVRAVSDTEVLRLLTRFDPDVVIVDKIDFDEALARDIKATLKARLIVFTNLTDANKYADVAVTADIGSGFRNVSYVDADTRTRYYYGPKYWVLRPEFYRYKSKAKVACASVRTVLLIFGGSDPADVTSVALRALLELDTALQIEVILGAHFSHDRAVKLVLDKHLGKSASVAVYRNVKNVADHMYQADLVIASPGLSVFEALCVGTPVIVMPQDALQRDTYQGFMRMLERNDVAKLGAMIEAGDFTYPHDALIAAMEIGEGLPELLQMILGRRTEMT